MADPSGPFGLTPTPEEGDRPEPVDVQGIVSDYSPTFRNLASLRGGDGVGADVGGQGEDRYQQIIDQAQQQGAPGADTPTILGNLTGQEVVGAPGFEEHPAQPVQPRETTSLDLLEQIYEMDSDSLEDLQLRMYAAGFYGDTPLEDIRLGDPDDAFAPWMDVVRRTAIESEVEGEPVSWGEVLDEAEQTAVLPESGGAAGQPVKITLSDPAALSQMLDNVAPSTIGRELDEVDKQDFIALVHGMQREQQTTQQAEGDATTTSVSPQARAEEFVRRQAPAEAAAHDMRAQMETVLRLFGSPTVGGG